jgi:hypothetical protein
MYSLFFDRMVIQYGKGIWKRDYTPILRILLVSFEGLDANQLSFFAGIEDNLLEYITNLKPFIVVEQSYKDKKRISRYKLYHQSLIDFLKKEYFDDDSENIFFYF